MVKDELCSSSGQQLKHSGEALACGAKLLRLWARILPGAGLFSFLYPISSASLIQVPHRDATLLIFIKKICLAKQLEAKHA